MRHVAEVRELDTMPMDKDFGNGLIHATGYQVRFEGESEWWDEFQDDDGDFYYGR